MFPRRIEAAVGDEEGALFGDVRNGEHLSILFQPKIVIVFDSLSGTGHRITFKDNDQKHRIYGFNPLNGRILSHNVYGQRVFEEYDIGSNQMVNEYALRDRVDEELNAGQFWKTSSCIFDGNSKLILSPDRINAAS